MLADCIYFFTVIMSVVLGIQPDVKADPTAASTIKEVRAYVIGTRELEAKSGGGADCHAQGKVLYKQNQTAFRNGHSRQRWLRAAGMGVVSRLLMSDAGPLDHRHAHRQPHVGLPEVQGQPYKLGHRRARNRGGGGGCSCCDTVPCCAAPVQD